MNALTSLLTAAWCRLLDAFFLPIDDDTHDHEYDLEQIYVGYTVRHLERCWSLDPARIDGEPHRGSDSAA